MTINSMTINVMQTINVMHRGGDSRLFVPTRHWARRCCAA